MDDFNKAGFSPRNMFIFKIEEFQNVQQNELPSQSASNIDVDLPSSSEASLVGYDDESKASNNIAGGLG